jgi:putrescine transport system ATP-binding protein
MAISIGNLSNKPVTETNKQPNNMVRIAGLSKYYKDIIAVDSVDLNIKKGEIFALLGSSGSGKSTLLRMIAGFEQATSGSIYLDGEEISELPPYKRPINMMFQSYALFPHMTVKQNIAFGLKQDKLSKDAIHQRLEEMLRLVHMEKFANRKPDQLSGGQKQRVALARSLAKRPKLLLLDEPMGALDKKLRTKMQLEVVEIIEDIGVTCIMVTHDQEEAMTMAERIGIMDNGWIVQQGSPIDIYENPSCKFSAGFIGSVNIFDGAIIEEQPSHVIIKSLAIDTNIYINHGINSSLENKNISVIIRPEKIQMSRQKIDSKYNTSKGIVEDIAYLGARSVYYIKLKSGFILQANITNSIRTSDNPTWGDTVYIYWDSQNAVALS